MIEIRPFSQENYETIKGWWEAYGIYPVELSALPATAAVAWEIDDDGEESMVAAAWVYLDNSVGFSCLAWPVTDPDARVATKFRGINGVVEFLTHHVSKDLGYNLMLTFSSVSSIATLMEHHGFTKFDQDVIFLSKGI